MSRCVLTCNCAEACFFTYGSCSLHKEFCHEQVRAGLGPETRPFRKAPKHASSETQIQPFLQTASLSPIACVTTKTRHLNLLGLLSEFV